MLSLWLQALTSIFLFLQTFTIVNRTNPYVFVPTYLLSLPENRVSVAHQSPSFEKERLLLYTVSPGVVIIRKLGFHLLLTGTGANKIRNRSGV